MCFGLGLIEHFLICLVVIVAVLAIIRMLLGLAKLQTLSEPQKSYTIIAAAIKISKIVLWSAIIIAVIVLVFGLACVVPIRM